MARKKSVEAQAESWTKMGERLILDDSEEERGVDEHRGSDAIKGLLYLAYAEGMMEAKYGYPAKWPDKGNSSWGDFLFDSGIPWAYAEAIARGAKKELRRRGS